ncbi:hypothetical protein AAEU42_13130 [Pseudoflavonifractor phocaeensis]|uniref:hypothetical protein n=1 Tax=Pseudoflavonifractor phocaeensis TaxID=1870988 RepID=UPI00313BAFE1
MSKKFIQVDNGRVMLIHNMPFDPVNGLGKTEAELNQMGVLLEEDQITEPEKRPGKTALPYYTPEKGFYWEYEDAPSGPASTDDIQALEAKLDYMGMMLDVM